MPRGEGKVQEYRVKENPITANKGVKGVHIKNSSLYLLSTSGYQVLVHIVDTGLLWQGSMYGEGRPIGEELR